jgi:hypothetical protein
MKHVLLAVLLLAGTLIRAQKTVDLFDGKSLNGWHSLPGGRWEVKDGLLVGTSPKSEPRHGLLISNDTYGDFEITVTYKAVKGNSGLYFRAEETGGTVGVSGFQAEIDPDKDAGGLYETNGREWVIRPTAEQVKTWYKPGEWNTMTVRAKGRDVLVTVNGRETARLTNDPGRTRGHIALQLHGGMDMEVYFKEVKLKKL